MLFGQLALLISHWLTGSWPRLGSRPQLIGVGEL